MKTVLLIKTISFDMAKFFQLIYKQTITIQQINEINYYKLVMFGPFPFLLLDFI